MSRIFSLSLLWSISRARDSDGWNRVRIVDDEKGTKYPSNCGGGYDMVGTALGAWIAVALKPELLTLNRKFYGLAYRDPDLKIDPNLSMLDHHQALLAKFTNTPTATNTEPVLNGGCGSESMCRIIEACGFEVRERRGNKQGNRTGFVIIELPKPEPLPLPLPSQLLELPILPRKPKIIRNRKSKR
jgi:hypothetical protein